jgi:Family of unknown function (DUF6491)
MGEEWTMSNLIRTTITFCFLVLVATAGSAQEKPETTTGDVPKAEKACFRVRDTRSFDAVDDRFVYLRCVRGKHYLLTMDNVCLGLQNSIAVAVANGYDRVCSNDHAIITYREFDLTKRCGILTVERVEDREAALKLVELRGKPAPAEGGEEKTAAPDDSDGRR